MKKRNRLMKISEETKQKLFQMKLELSHLEKRQLPMGEIVERMLKGEDIPERLRLGAMERRKRKR